MTAKKKDLEKLLSGLAKLAAANMMAQPATTEVAVPGCTIGGKSRSTSSLPHPAIPPRYVTMAYSDVCANIRARMPLAPDCVVKVCDEFVTTYTADAFMMFMDYANARNDPEYKSEQFDCDDFSVTFCATARKWHARVSALLRGRIASEIAIAQIPLRAPCAHTVPRAAYDATPDGVRIGGAPIGMCHGKLSGDSGEHAFNFWIMPSTEIVYIEPQTGEFITFGVGASIDFVYL
jgi:hypothetical protein